MSENNGARSSGESDYSYESSRGSSRPPSDDSYLSERESKTTRENTTNKQGIKQTSKSQPPKKARLLVRGQREPIKNGRGDENVTKKMLYENKIKMSEMRNKNLELADLISKYEVENRDLMRIIRKQEKMLKQFQEQENSMPALLQRQSAESHALQEQLRNLKKKLKHQEEKLKSAEDELEQKQRLLKKMKGLVDDHQLKERNELQQKLNDVENELKNKSDIIKNLERHIENLNKNHKHELGLKKAKQQTTSEELGAVRAELARVQSQLHEKEKELAVLNIYAQQRFQAKPPHRLPSSIRSTPVFDKNENQSSKNKNRTNSLNESKNIETSPNSEVHVNKSLDQNVRKNVANKYDDRKLNVPKNNQTTNDKKVKENDDLDKRIEEMEKKAKIKSKQQRPSLDSTDKSETDLTKTRVVHDTKNNQKQKEILLAKMKEIDESNASLKKSSKQPIFDDDFDNLKYGTYRPSFGETAKPNYTRSKKKSEVLSGLFEDDLENFKDEIRFDKGRSKSPVLLNLSNDGSKRTQVQASNKSNLLPLRMKQQVSSLGTLNGIDSDEEIKELKLK